MKKKKRSTGEGGGSRGVEGGGGGRGQVTPSPLPPHTVSASLPHLDQDQDVKIWSVQYVPELYTVDRSLQRRHKKVVKV